MKFSFQFWSFYETATGEPSRSGWPLVLSLTITCGAANSFAQTYPAKPIRIISATPTGTSGDIAIRLAAPIMGAALGQPLIIDSRPAAGGQVAAVAVKQSPPDGYTALISASAPMVTNRYLIKNVPYDTLVDFAPVSKVISVPNIFVVTAALPVNSVAEFIDYAKKFPGKLAFGSTGNGTAFHMIGESLSIETGIKMLHVPYAAQGLAQPLELQGTQLVEGKTELGKTLAAHTPYADRLWICLWLNPKRR